MRQLAVLWVEWSALKRLMACLDGGGVEGSRVV